MKKPIIVIVLMSLINIVFSQEIKTKKVIINHSNGLTKEVYYVDKKNEKIKEGKYTYYFQDEIITEGSYSNNRKDGKWNFYDYSGKLNFFGFYKDNLKTGKWEYFLDDSLQSVLYYHEDVLDSMFGYYKNGKLNSETKYFSDNTGFVKQYYDNGQLWMFYELKNGYKNGMYRSYFKNGQLYREYIHKDSKPYTVIKSFDINGNEIDGGDLKEGTGTFITYYAKDEGQLVVIGTESYKNGREHGEYKRYQTDGKIMIEGQLEDGYKVGVWKSNNKYSDKIDTFKLTDSVEFMDISNYSVLLPKLISESMPEFPGGDKARMKYISKTLEYPQIEREYGIQGLVVISYVVGVTGEITDIAILKGVSPNIDKESIKLAEEMPRWNPGFQNGVPVKVTINLPLRYTLQ